MVNLPGFIFNWLHLAHEPRRCKNDLIFVPLQANSSFAEDKGNRFYELMNLMNLERDFDAYRISFRKIGPYSKLNNHYGGGFLAYKFIKFIPLFFGNYLHCFITKLLLKTVINDEYMNTNEQTYGLLPLFSMWLVNR